MDINSMNVGRAMEGIAPTRGIQKVEGQNVSVNESTSGGKDITVERSALRSKDIIIDRGETSEESKKNNLREISKAVDKLNKVIEDEDVYAKYEVHEKLNQIMIKLIDRNTDEVIFEVPPKKILDMVAKMCEMAGLLIDKKA